MTHDSEHAIEHLRSQGVVFEAGLSNTEIVRVEALCGCSLPPDYRQFLQTALPVSGGFPNWRSESDSKLCRRFIDRVREGIAHDVEHNFFWLSEWGTRPEEMETALLAAEQWMAEAPPLIPIRIGHYLPASPSSEGNPVFAVRQSDVSIVGRDLFSWLTDTANVPHPDECRSIPFWTTVAKENQITVPDLAYEQGRITDPDKIRARDLKYEELIDVLRSAGCWAKVISTHDRETGVSIALSRPADDRRGSLWLTRGRHGWFLNSFYYLMQGNRITDLCIALLAHVHAHEHEPAIESRVLHPSDDIRREFGLVALHSAYFWGDVGEAELRLFEKHGWRAMSDGQQDEVWTRYDQDFEIPETAPTFDGAFAYLRGDHHREEIERDLGQKTLAALRECTKPGEEILCIDINHQYYFFNPHHENASMDPSSRAIPLLPDGDTYVFLAEDFRFGIFGNCVDQTMCVFGEPLLDAFSSRMPIAFQRSIGTAQERKELESKWEATGWMRLPGGEPNDDLWDDFVEQFQFQLNRMDGPRIQEPSTSITWSIATAFNAPEQRADLEADLTQKILNAMCCAFPPDESLYAHDVVKWTEHYTFYPHRIKSVTREEWALPVFPDECFTIMLTADRTAGIFGDPLDQTMCIFGETLLDAIFVDLPRLFEAPLRENGYNRK